MTWYPRYDITWYDMVYRSWYNVVKCHELWYDMAWHDISHMIHCRKYGMIQDNIMWHMPCYMWHDMTWYDIKWHEINGMTWNYMWGCCLLCQLCHLPPLSHQHKGDHCISWKSEQWCMLCNIQRCFASSGGF